MKKLNNINKIMIYAYTRFNLGDDLLIKILCDRYSGIEFHLYTYPEYKDALSICKNLKIHSNAKFQAKLINTFGKIIGNINVYEQMIAKKCNICVCISGSLFIQGGDNWQSYFNYMKSRKIKNIPYFQIGSNFGPYTDEMFLNRFRELFFTYEDICFREQYTADLFAGLKNVRVAPDVVFSGDYKKYIKNSTEKRVAISVIDLTNRNDLKQYKIKYLNYIEKICRKYLNEGYCIDLLSFCKAEGDENAVAEMERRLNKRNVKHYLYYTDTDLEGILNCIGSAEIVIATRFHAMILGWCMGKKTLPIVYSSKMTHVLEEFKYPNKIINIKELENTYIDELFINYSFDTYNIINESQKQFLKLDKFVIGQED